MLSGNGGPQTAGESYTLTCTASGGESGTPTYQWCKDGTLVTTPSSPDIFSFSPLGQADSGGYNCTVTRGSMIVTSELFTITVGSKKTVFNLAKALKLMPF